MKKTSQSSKCFAITALILFLGLAFLPAVQSDNNSIIASFNGNTLYVGGSGSGNYTKIQDAIDNATDSVTYSDTVFVYNGIYNESLVIKKRIKIQGENKENTILQGSGLTSTINVKAYDVKISNLSITNKNNKHGIYIKAKRRIIISFCDIYSCDVGIKFYGPYDFWFPSFIVDNKNIIDNCNIFSNNNGIEIFSDFVPDAPSFNYFIDALKDIDIKNCQIHSNNNSGILIFFSRDIKIINSKIYSNKIGILNVASKYNVISNCDIHSNNYGIKNYLSSINRINNCNISSNKIGIGFNTSFLNSITNCKYHNNEQKINRELSPELLFSYLIFKILYRIRLLFYTFLYSLIFVMLF